MSVTQAGPYTHDALTVMEYPAKFDVTHWPLEVEAHLERTENPFHRAILKNYLRHLLLEISGYWDQIIVPELTVENPSYRVGEMGRVHVIEGREAVEGFYRDVCESGINVMGARTMNMCVEDFGVTTEAYWTHVVPGSYLQSEDVDVDAEADAYYLMNYNLFQVFTYTTDAKLIGERIYSDAASYQFEKLAPEDVTTPAQAREQLRPLLDRATLD